MIGISLDVGLNKVKNFVAKISNIAMRLHKPLYDIKTTQYQYDQHTNSQEIRWNWVLWLQSTATHADNKAPRAQQEPSSARNPLLPGSEPCRTRPRVKRLCVIQRGKQVKRTKMVWVQIKCQEIKSPLQRKGSMHNRKPNVPLISSALN